MYNQFFGLRKNPFRLTPDPEFLYVTPQHREALAGFTYAILARKGFVMLTGDAGTGKTTAELQSLLTYLTAGWDFVGKSCDGTDPVWKMCCGRRVYPKLAWEQVLVGDFVDPEGVGFEDLAFLAQHWLQTVALPCDSPDLD
ncbi:MAG: hypothetical protein LAQ30_04425, partial [Acidobacteriia bacterium]|nr:hypothetical protein [Terriglobia bacterium]